MAPECTFSPRQSEFSPCGATATQQVKVPAVGSSRRWVYVGGSSADSSGSPQVSSPEQLVVRGVLELERDQPHVHLVIHRSPRELATIHRLGISALIRARQAFYVSAGPTVEVHRSPPTSGSSSRTATTAEGRSGGGIRGRGSWRRAPRRCRPGRTDPRGVHDECRQG